MLSLGAFTLDANGRIRNTGGAPTSFCNGIPLAGANNLLTTHFGVAPATFLNGNPLSTPGALCCEAADPTNYNQGGLPLTANDRVAVDSTGAGVIAFYNAGLPYTAAGRLVLALPE